ncbi:hypothetical protein BH11PSE1_BH11PSE1_15160 [soil metagenome]
MGLALGLFATFGVVGPLALAADTTPGLNPGERLVPVKNCAVILEADWAGASAEQVAKSIDLLATYRWTGECRSGLANGVGMLFPQALIDQFAQQNMTYTQEYVFGRDTGISNMTSTVLGRSTTYRRGGRSVELSNVDDALTPVWADLSTDSGPKPSGVSLTETVNGQTTITRVSTTQSSCWIDREKYKGCGLNNDFQVYGVDVASMTAVQKFSCPNPRTPKGCDVLWREKLDPVRARIAAVIGDVGTNGSKLRAEAPDWFVAWEAGYKARQEVAAQAARDKAVREAAVRAEAAQLAQAQAAKAAATRAAADQAFQAGLKTKNAGQLFVLADDLRNGGEPQKARDALRALISRFPDSPLSATAAQQLSNLPPGPSSSAAPQGGSVTRASTSGGGKVASGRDCESILWDFVKPLKEKGPFAAPTMAADQTTEQMYEHSVWSQRQFLRLADAIPACRGDPARQKVADAVASEIRQCKQYSRTPGTCERGAYNGGAPDRRGSQAAIEQALQAIINSNSAGRSTVAMGAQPGPASSACRQALASNDALLNASTQAGKSYKLNENGSGSKAIFQHAMWATWSRMQVLDASCRGEPEYQQYEGLKVTYDGAKRSCVQLSSDGGGSCVPARLY